MPPFLVNVLEQMDLALDQLAVSDVNYRRFALMLVDNVVELTLHQHASETAAENERWGKLREPKHPPKLVQAAMGQHFKPKTRLAEHTGLISRELKDSLLILHWFRNQVYHRGMTHEAILPAISLFYFRNACDLLKSYQPRSVRWGINDSIPYRARKYLGNVSFLDLTDRFPQACDRIREVSEGFELDLPCTLADHVESTIDEIDHWIEFLADDSPETRTRDEVVIDSQVWPFTFTDDGKKFAIDNACSTKTIAEYVDWMKAHYSWKVRKDPIPGWKRRLTTFRKETDPHKALKLYHSFMEQTDELRSQIIEAAARLGGWIENQSDLAREKQGEQPVAGDG